LCIVPGNPMVLEGGVSVVVHRFIRLSQ
jgi:hypothetical protein